MEAESIEISIVFKYAYRRSREREGMKDVENLDSWTTNNAIQIIDFIKLIIERSVQS